MQSGPLKMKQLNFNLSVFWMILGASSRRLGASGIDLIDFNECLVAQALMHTYLVNYLFSYLVAYLTYI